MGKSISAKKIDWKEGARLMGERVGRGRLMPEGVELLDGYEGRVGVAISGGVDSLMLGLMVWVHFEGMRDRVVWLHYNHGMRGDESEAEEMFVRDVAKDMGIELVVGSDQEVDRDANEGQLRGKRHGFFNKEMDERGIGVLLLGHHSDDLVENMLIRMSRGSGLDGLSGMRGVTVFRKGYRYVRLLRELRKSEIVEVFEELGLPYCKDSSNESGVYLRNRLRKEVLPAWEKASDKDIYKGVRRTQMLLEEALDGLEAVVSKLYTQEELSGEVLDIKRLSGHGRVFCRMVFMQWLTQVGWSGKLRAVVVDDFVERIYKKREGQVSVGSGWVLCLENEAIFIAKG